MTGILVAVVDGGYEVVVGADVFVIVEVHADLDTVVADDWPVEGLAVALIAVDLVVGDVVAAETGAPASDAKVACPQCCLWWWLVASELPRGRVVALHLSFLIDT